MAEGAQVLQIIYHIIAYYITYWVSLVQAFIQELPWRKACMWAAVVLAAYQLKDFFGIAMGVFIISFIGNGFVQVSFRSIVLLYWSLSVQIFFRSGVLLWVFYCLRLQSFISFIS